MDTNEGDRMKKIAAIVVTYNPESDFEANISSYINQVEIVIIIDNCSSPEALLLVNKFASRNENCILVKNMENFGIARALNVGILKAIELSCENVIFFDQDSKATSNLIKKLSKSFKILSEKNNLAMVGPVPVEEKYLNAEHNDETEVYSLTSFLITSGTYSSVDIFSKIGFFEDKYFIYHVDTEFCLRALKEGYLIYRIDNAILIHNDGNKVMRRFFGRQIYVNNYNDIRHYYSVRNLFFLSRSYFKCFPKKLIIFHIKELWDGLKIIMFENNKRKKLGLKFKGFRDFLTGKQGAIELGDEIE